MVRPGAALSLPGRSRASSETAEIRCFRGRKSSRECKHAESARTLVPDNQGLDEARLDENHVDFERRHLHSHHVRHHVQGSFGDVVGSHERAVGAQEGTCRTWGVRSRSNVHCSK